MYDDTKDETSKDLSADERYGLYIIFNTRSQIMHFD